MQGVGLTGIEEGFHDNVLPQKAASLRQRHRLSAGSPIHLWSRNNPQTWPMARHCIGKIYQGQKTWRNLLGALKLCHTGG